MQTIFLHCLYMLYETLFRLSSDHTVFSKMSISQISRHLVVALINSFGQIVRYGKVFGVLHLKNQQPIRLVILFLIYITFATHARLEVSDFRLQGQTTQFDQIIVAAQDLIFENAFPKLQIQQMAGFRRTIWRRHMWVLTYLLTNYINVITGKVRTSNPATLAKRI